MRYPGKHKKGRFLGKMLFFLLILGYILAAMLPVPEQPRLEQEWSITLDSDSDQPLAPASASQNGDSQSQVSQTGISAEQTEGASQDLQWVPFYSGDSFGYVSPEGRMLLQEKVLDGLAISRQGFVNYSMLGNSLVYNVPQEQFIYSIRGGGAPFFRGGQLWLISADHTNISAVGSKGDVQYRIGFSTLITSMDSRGDVATVGLLDGEVHIFNGQGQLLWKLGTEENGGPVYGTAVSPKGKRVAFVRGLDPQRLYMYKVTKSGTVLEYEREIESPLRRELQLAFARDGGILFCETASGAWMRDLEEGRERTVAINGELIDYLIPSAKAPFFLATANEQGGALIVLSVDNGVFTEEKYPTALRMLSGNGKSVYVATEESLHKVRLVCE